jgi:hypothetical protein
MKAAILAELSSRYGKAIRLEKSQSLYRFGDKDLFVYFRYSKVHRDRDLFYGLRSQDLQQLEGRCASICFLWDGQKEPVFMPYREYEDVFQSVKPANDGQFKVHLRVGDDGVDLSIPKVGRFSLDPYIGWESFERMALSLVSNKIPKMSHAQIQQWLSAIGAAKNFDVWVPLNDRPRVSLAGNTGRPFIRSFPNGFEHVRGILSQVDVLWLDPGSSRIRALFEVEHSTTIYSGLLRLNDIMLVVPNMEPTFSIVADDERRSSFLRQINRPTFQRSGLSDLCRFMKYEDIFAWHVQATKPIHV